MLVLLHGPDVATSSLPRQHKIIINRRRLCIDGVITQCYIHIISKGDRQMNNVTQREPLQHIIAWLSTLPTNYAVRRQIEYYIWLQTGKWVSITKDS